MKLSTNTQSLSRRAKTGTTCVSTTWKKSLLTFHFGCASLSVKNCMTENNTLSVFKAPDAKG